MKRLDMREHTGRAAADICGILLSEYGIVPSFQVMENIAKAVDREVLSFGNYARNAGPCTWESISKRGVYTTGRDQEQAGATQ